MNGTRRTPMFTGLIFALTLGLGGCVGDPPPETRIFTMEVAEFPLPLGDPLPGTLQVRSLSSATVYADRRLAWRDLAEPQQIQLFNHYLWSSAPPRLFQEQLFRCLDGAQAAEAVLPNAVPVAVDFSLAGEIERLELQVGARRSQAVVQVVLYLTDSESRELLWTERFDYAEDLPRNTPEATAEAFSHAMTRLCYDITALVRQTDAKAASNE